MGAKYTVGSLFSGIGGIDYAFREAGFSIMWQVEIDTFCRQVLAKHFPDATRHADIYDCHDLPHVDVLTAGFPCQPFSLAGKRLGEQDERYLIPEMFRVIQEVKPHVILFENVPGFASITDGSTFRDFLRSLAAIGFDAEWTHLRAADAGAPHRRERWFCVAYCADTWADRWDWLKRDDAKSGGVGSNGSISNGGLECVADSNQSERQTCRPYRMGASQSPRSFARLSSMAYPSSSGRQECHTATIANRTRHTTGRNTTTVGNAASIRRKHHQPITRSAGTGKGKRRLLKSQRTGHRQLERGLGRDAHGLPARLDGHIFPAPPGAAQHPAEPPRVTTHAQDRAKRLKALGNAVVPQVIYPIALAIKEWLDAN